MGVFIHIGPQCGLDLRTQQTTVPQSGVLVPGVRKVTVRKSKDFNGLYSRRLGVSREWGDGDTGGTIGRVDGRLGERGCDGCCG